MTFKEFKKWCNERSCDGGWGFKEAVLCVNTISQVNKYLFWKREKKWQAINEILSIEENIVKPVNEKMKKVFDKENANV